MRESDIRPRKLLQTYLSLSEQDAHTLFANVTRHDIPCVACGSKEIVYKFTKSTFDYAGCSVCGTLYQTPRPPLEAFECFYVNSKSSDFWAREFFPSVASIRRKTVIAPRARDLAEMLRERNFSPRTIIDVGAGHGLFLVELTARLPKSKGIAIEPSREMAAKCRGNGFETHEHLVEDITDMENTADLVCSLEVLEHVHSPLVFMKRLAAFARPGGYVFFTTLGADGFDIRMLGKHSDAVFPPHHLNFMSVEGFKTLCHNVGLEDVTITTPGKLDVDIVRNKLKEQPGLLNGQEFLQALVFDGEKSEAFQKFLADNQLSSHTWVLARKPRRDELEH